MMVGVMSMDAGGPMKEAGIWIEEYAKDHQNSFNRAVHHVCVPLIVISLIGLLWSLPVPVAFTEISPALNWGTTFILASVVYYFIISMPLAIGMLPIMLAVVVIVNWLDQLGPPLWAVSAGIFVVAWIGQFIGHHVEGRKPAFFRDLQFLMIGPLWVLAGTYRKLGIRY